MFEMLQRSGMEIAYKEHRIVYKRTGWIRSELDVDQARKDMERTQDRPGTNRIDQEWTWYIQIDQEQTYIDQELTE